MGKNVGCVHPIRSEKEVWALCEKIASRDFQFKRLPNMIRMSIDHFIDEFSTSADSEIKSCDSSCLYSSRNWIGQCQCIERKQVNSMVLPTQIYCLLKCCYFRELVGRPRNRNPYEVTSEHCGVRYPDKPPRGACWEGAYWGFLSSSARIHVGARFDPRKSFPCESTWWPTCKVTWTWGLRGPFRKRRRLSLWNPSCRSLLLNPHECAGVESQPALTQGT